MSERSDLDELLDEANSGMAGIVKRMLEKMPVGAREDFEREAFGVEAPEVKAAREHQEDLELKADPPSGDEPWREEFRRNWPGGPRKTKRWSR